MTPGYPFEWLGAYDLPAGRHTLLLGAAPDPSVDLLLLAAGESSDGAVDGLLRQATLAFSDQALSLDRDHALSAAGGLVRAALRDGGTSVAVKITEPGSYVLFCEHGAAELELSLIDDTGAPVEPTLARQIAPDHEHDDTVSSVGITQPGDLDRERFNEWLGILLQERGQDIFRMKGVLSIDQSPRRFVFQGVHMLFDGQPDRLWGDEERVNKLIFIGRHLDRSELEEGFRACLV